MVVGMVDYDLLEKMSQQSNDVDAQVEKDVTLKMVTFNILAPIYKRITTPAGSKAFESDYPELFLERNMKICLELLDTHADIICLQEFWSGSDVLKQLYIDYLCKPNAHNDSPYSMRILTRTSYWRSRGDSIAIFVKNDSLEIQDVQEILFHDCGDRVALMLLLGLRSSGQNTPSISPPPSSSLSSIQTDPSSATDASSSPSSLSTDQLPPTMSLVDDQGPQLCTTDSSQERPLQRFICVNTHLLFPHNPYSSQIRLREITKILGFIEAYKQKDLCSTVCDRADVRLPVIIAGDFNGSPKGSVYKYIRSQNFRSAMEEFYNDDASVEVINAEGTTLTDGNDVIDKIEVVEDYLNGQRSDSIDDMEDNSINTINGDEDKIQKNNPHVVTVVPPYSIDQSSAPLSSSSSSSSSSSLYGGTASVERWNNWVSHKSHLGKDVAVDHIFYLNPSEQTKELLPPLPDWTNLVWREIMQRIVDQQGGAAITREVFRSFDQDGSSYVTREEFKTALLSLGFVGENCPCLTNEEIDMLVYSADKNADGLIDYKEFYDRFWLASVVQQPSKQLLSPSDENQGIADAVDNDITDIGGSGFGDDRVNDDDDDDSIGSRSDITQDSSSDSIETNLNSNRLLLARSKWLTERIDPSIITNNNNNTRGDVEQGDKMMIYDQYAERNNIIEVCSELDSGEVVVLLEPMQSYMQSLSEENKHFFEAMYLNRNNDYLNSDGLSGDNNNNNNDNNNDNDNNNSDDNNSHVITEGSQSLVDYAYSKSNRINVVPLGDLSVVSVRIIPKEMEGGVWPADYSLSDHGLIECVFKAKVNT